MLDRMPQVFLPYSWTSKEYLIKEEPLLLLSDLQKFINQVVLIDYIIIILGWACGHFFRPLCLYSFYNLED